MKALLFPVLCCPLEMLPLHQTKRCITPGHLRLWTQGREEWDPSQLSPRLFSQSVCHQWCTGVHSVHLYTLIRVTGTRTLKMSLIGMRTHLLTKDQTSDPIMMIMMMMMMMTSSLQTWASVSWPSCLMPCSSWWRMSPSTPSTSPETSCRRSRPSSRSTFVWSKVGERGEYLHHAPPEWSSL